MGLVDVTLLSNEDFADGLYHLAVAIDAHEGGGNDPSCGVDYRNDVFEMWGFWPHSECRACEGFEWDAETLIREKMDDPHARIENYAELLEEQLTWMPDYQAHLPDCPYREWHFHHYASGLKVKWYKRIGRSTESNVAGSAVGWYRILIECIESVEKGVK